eukprot:TRINITY_DN4399_c0_g1_i1.p1 TRINITY_DN4399_c0_g1~~TRINITY_DN4399_c0_g1_i1.p1  ORF type:complete len:101 (+),score=9.26 TRINITY_DN4399_c0_g1_i1:81-383(+)
MQYNKIREFGKRYKKNDYLDVFTPINIVKKSNNNNIYNTINCSNSYSINDFGRSYKARQSYRPFQLNNLLSHITDKYTHSQKEKSTDCDSALIPLLCVHG